MANQYEIIGYFIEMKNPENVVVEKKVVSSDETLIYIFNSVDELLETSKLDEYYRINWTVIDLSNPKERYIKLPGMTCPFKEELL